MLLGGGESTTWESRRGELNRGPENVGSFWDADKMSGGLTGSGIARSLHLMAPMPPMAPTEASKTRSRLDGTWKGVAPFV